MTDWGMRRIREHYKVPARRGLPVVFDGTPGIITSADSTSMHLYFRADGAAHSVRIHPTWHVEYPAAALVPDPQPVADCSTCGHPDADHHPHEYNAGDTRSPGCGVAGCCCPLMPDEMEPAR